MNTPFPYYAPELARSVGPASQGAAEAMLARLRHPGLHELIGQGCVTLAMIRPQVGPEANILGLPDLAAADKIEEMIGGLGVMTKFSFRFMPDMVRVFYDNAREAMQNGAPRDARYASRWEEYCDFMASGATTALLLYSPEGDAIEKWRAQLGHWNIDENRDPATIRGQLGVDKFNNLLHGSDSPASVERELGIISSLLASEAA